MYLDDHDHDHDYDDKYQEYYYYITAITTTVLLLQYENYGFYDYWTIRYGNGGIF